MGCWKGNELLGHVDWIHRHVHSPLHVSLILLCNDFPLISCRLTDLNLAKLFKLFLPIVAVWHFNFQRLMDYSGLAWYASLPNH